jgi:FkbM family methyltransferase
MSAREPRVANILARLSWRVAARLVRLIPRGLGQVRVARVIRPRLKTGKGVRLESRTKQGVRLALDPTHWLQAETFLTGDWQPEMTAILAEALPAGGVFFDVGANVGLASLSVAMKAEPASVVVHAFEPDPVNVAALRRNLELNPDLDVRVHAVAVGARIGRASLVLQDEPSHHYISRDPAQAIAATVTVPVIALDDYAAENGLDRIDVMKVDVEGYELEVLRGARGLLAERQIRLIVCEIVESHLRRAGTTMPEVCRELLSQGYRPYPLLPIGHRIRQVFSAEIPSLSGDVAFVPLET